ncbi:MAG: Crp/Fnr family transcriptional regulator [Planctomycetota bacterium]|nr:Crp/Fnr family transcriptional regulator [Planctomycetota bacterium]
MMPVYMSSRVVGESLLAGLLGDTALEAQRIEVPAKAALYQPNDAAKSIFYIHAGQVRTYQASPTGSRRLIEVLGVDQWCGAAALAGLECYGEAAEAVEPATATVVAVDRLFVVLGHEPQGALELIRQLACKLATYRQDASDLVFEDCNHRLIRTLVYLSDSPAASPTVDGVVLRITHQQLAQKVGVARETVSLALAQLRRKNLLRTGRNQLFFNPQTLQGSGNGSGDGSAVGADPSKGEVSVR